MGGKTKHIIQAFSTFKFSPNNRMMDLVKLISIEAKNDSWVDSNVNMVVIKPNGLYKFRNY